MVAVVVALATELFSIVIAGTIGAGLLSSFLLQESEARLNTTTNVR
jgi:hypothetical protein